MWRLKSTTISFYLKEKLTKCPIEKLLKARKNALKPLASLRSEMENRAMLKQLKFRVIGLVQNY